MPMRRGTARSNASTWVRFYKDGVSFFGFPVVGHQSLIMRAEGCQRSDLAWRYCAWDARIKNLEYFDADVALPLRSLSAFLAAVKRLRAAVPKSLCDLDLYSGILIRFGKRTEAYLGTAQEDDMAMVAFVWSRRADATAPRLDMDVFQELEQIAFEKFGEAFFLSSGKDLPSWWRLSH